MTHQIKMPRFLLLSALGASLFLVAPSMASAAPSGPDANIATHDAPSKSGKAKRAKLQKRGKAHKAKKGHKKMAKRMCEALECTDEQKTEIKKIRKSMKAEYAPVKRDMRSLHGELEAERAKGEPDAERIAELREALKRKRGVAKGLRGERRERVKGVLTPEQRDEFERIIAQRKAEKRKHKAKGKDGRKDGAKKNRGKHKGDKNIAKRGRGKQGKGKGKRQLAV